MSRLTLGSLFDGSGGFPLAAKIVGIKPVWASEIEPFPIRVTTKRMPDVKHLGDIREIKGDEIEPVDIITFGSPCQDLSIAGKREGLKGRRSNLFHEAIRIIKEMRCKTGGEKPRYILWENVPGAFSSNKGRDFQKVLGEILSIKDEMPEIPMPKDGRWAYADRILGDGCSLAWRVLDAQYFRVPQRRKRIFLIADFNGTRATEILFDQKSLSRDTQKSEEERKRNTRTSQKGAQETICIADQGGERIDFVDNMSPTLRAKGGQPPFVYDYTSAHYALEDASSQCEAVSDLPNTRKASVVRSLFENHSQDGRFFGPLSKSPTLSSTLGIGGNNQPLVTYDIRQTSEKTKNERHNIYPCDVSRTIDTSGNTPTRNQGGVAIIQTGPIYSMSKNSHFTKANQNKVSSLVATDYKDPPLIAEQYVRRLTPKECGRLQGFPDDWCEDLKTENPTKEELEFWMSVFQTDGKIRGLKKDKTETQIKKWLQDPHTDSAEYKMWGNGIALPCVVYILQRLKD